MRRLSSKLLGKQGISRKQEQAVQMSCGWGQCLEWVRKAGWAAQKFQRKSGELRMGLWQGHTTRPWWGLCLYLVSVRKTRKGKLHRGSAEECGLGPVIQSILIRLWDLIWRAWGQHRLKGLVSRKRIKGAPWIFTIFENVFRISGY